MPIKHDYKDLLEVNGYIQKLADSFYFMCTTRTVQESKPVPGQPVHHAVLLQRLVPLAAAAAQGRRGDAG